MLELSKQFYFDAAHTLIRAPGEPFVEGSRRIHGHSFRTEITIEGNVDAKTGMVVDYSVMDRSIAKIRDALDHRLLDEVPGLAIPTMENLCIWIWEKLKADFPNLTRVTIYRDSCQDSCTYRGEHA